MLRGKYLFLIVLICFLKFMLHVNAAAFLQGNSDIRADLHVL